MLDPKGARIRLPAGVRDFLPRAAARRRQLASRLMHEFDLFGFERIITPLLARLAATRMSEQAIAGDDESLAILCGGTM